MLRNRNFKALELFVLFVLIPVLLTVSWSVIGKISLGILGFVYIIVLTFISERPSLVSITRQQWQRFLKTTFFKFLFIAVALSLFMYISNPEKLYYVVLTKPKVWGFFLGVYTLFSVLPQEFLYRTFFFKRYEDLFHNSNLFILVNAGLFSLGHLFFGNTLVMFITFIGGLLFAYTYSKTNSTLFVIIEHALYGSCLYTVGMGEMLGFPA